MLCRSSGKDGEVMQTSNPLTEDDVLHYLRLRRKRGESPPSLREIATHVGHKTTLSVQRILNRLEKQSLIQREAGKSRSLRLTESTARSRLERGLPILGRVAAGPL